jgi:hypothetical protein
VGLLDAFKQYLGDAAPGGALNPEWTPERVRAAGGLLADFTPVVGGLKGFVDEMQAGNPGWAAFNAATVPLDIASLGGASMLKGAALPLFAAMARNKQTVSIPAVKAVFDAIGVKPAKVMADIDHLARKHPEHFTGADDVERHLTHVFGGAPDAVLPASDPRYTLLARSAQDLPVSTGEAYRGATTDFTGARNGNYWVRNATPMTAEQVQVKGLKNEAGIKGSEPIAGLRGLDIARSQIPGHGNGVDPLYTSLGGSISKPAYSPQYQAALDAGLDMSYEARMQRAAQQGFDVNLFHGTSKDLGALSDRSMYLTNVPEYASRYTNPSASSLGGKTAADFLNASPNVMPVKTRSADLFDTRNPTHRKIFERDFLNQYGNGTPLQKTGLPDWVDGESFAEFFADKGLPFKGVVLDEGADMASNGNPISRGISTAIFDPANIRSTNAAFNPANIGKTDLLGRADPTLLPWLTGGGLLGSYFLNQDANP